MKAPQQLPMKPMTMAAAALQMMACRRCSASTIGKCWSCHPRIHPQMRSETSVATVHCQATDGRLSFAAPNRSQRVNIPTRVSALAALVEQLQER